MTAPRPRDYSFYEERDGRMWCGLCQDLIPPPKNPVYAAQYDNKTAMMSHSIIAHIEKRL